MLGLRIIAAPQIQAQLGKEASQIIELLACGTLVDPVEGRYFTLQQKLGRRYVANKKIRRDDRVVLFNTGSATKYVETVPINLQVLDNPHTLDYGRFMS